MSEQKKNGSGKIVLIAAVVIILVIEIVLGILLFTSNNNLQKEIASVKENEIAQLQQADQALTANIASLEEKDASAELALSELKESTGASITALETQMTETGTSIATLSGSVNAAREQFIDMEGKVTAAEAAVTALETKANESAAAITALQSNADSAAAAITALEGKADSTAASITALEGKADSTAASITALEGKADTAAASITALEGKADTAAASITALEGKADSAAASITALETKANESAAAITTLEATTGTMNAAITEMQQSSAATNGRVNSLEGFVEDYERRQAITTTVGDNVFFGRYEQDNDTADGKEEIEWIVLAIEGDKALLISRYVLDQQEFASEKANDTWETSDLRAWLNGTFINAAFNQGQQDAIITTTLDNGPDTGYAYFRNENGAATADKVFCLSYQEVLRYIGTSEKRTCLVTDYVASQPGVYDTMTGNAYWWLRSTGLAHGEASAIYMTGIVNSQSVDVDYVAVRPAMWVDLGSTAFAN